MVDLSHPLRPAILAAAKSSRMRNVLTGFRPTRKVVERFIAGESRTDALRVVAQLRAQGRAVSLDYLGEDTVEPAQADAVVAEYLALVEALAGDDGMEVSLKLSAVGQSISENLAADNAFRVCTAARDAGVLVTVDAEDHTTTDSTHRIVRQLRAEFDRVGLAVQAYLHRTPDDLAIGGRIRLCKGAYREPPEVAHQRDADVTAAYLHCLELLMDGTAFPMVASHDPRLIAAADGYQRPFEYQMLYGIRDLEQQRLVESGRVVRTYVPYGTQWYGYFMRRLAERPSNLRFFLRSLATRT